jgi:A/G-specific adenine glycosylase
MRDVLVDWFSANLRPLPWRDRYIPYRVWISEVMLQQTQMDTVLPFYERFMAQFPTIRALAAADEASVLQLWSGLGYYSRARNLLAAAKIVVRDHHARVPSDYDSLRALPGVGRYMAGAILSVAFNKPYPAVDGNVRRVLSRVHGWTDDLPERVWSAAAELAERGEPRLVNQALMELGATICSFRRPRCLLCPVNASCVAFKTGRQTEIPKAKSRPATVNVRLAAVVERRGAKYRMKNANGLWEFPMFNAPPSAGGTLVGRCRHTITHHRLDVAVYTGSLQAGPDYAWKDPDTVPLSSLTRKILSAAQNKTKSNKATSIKSKST